MEDFKVLATVNGKEITDKHVDSLLHSLGPQRSAQFNSIEGRKQLLNELISQELFYLEAKEKDMDKEEGFKRELEHTKENLLKQYAIRSALNQAEISEKEVSDYYEQNKERFKNEESVKASHILVDTEDTANEILENIKAGLEFEEAAKVNSKCPSKENGGDLGYFTKGRMVAEFEKAAFKMEKGELSSPVRTQFGYHIIKVIDKKPENIMKFEEVKDDLTQQIIAMKQNEIYNKKSEELKNKYDVKINE